MHRSNQRPKMTVEEDPAAEREAPATTAKQEPGQLAAPRGAAEATLGQGQSDRATPTPQQDPRTTPGMHTTLRPGAGD